VKLIKPLKCVYSSISNLCLQLTQNQNKGRESCVIPMIPCCAIGGGQRTTKSGIRKNSLVHLRVTFTLVMLNYLIKYFTSQSRFIINFAMLFTFQIYMKWKHICSTSYKNHKWNLCLNSYVLYNSTVWRRLLSVLFHLMFYIVVLLCLIMAIWPKCVVHD